MAHSCTEIHFIQVGVKVNGAYYRDSLLAKKLMQDIFRISHDVVLFFNRKVHWRIEHETPERNVPDFIPQTLWPPNSPDLNPVNYSIWSVLQEKSLPIKNS